MFKRLWLVVPAGLVADVYETCLELRCMQECKSAHAGITQPKTKQSLVGRQQLQITFMLRSFCDRKTSWTSHQLPFEAPQNV